MMDHGFQWWLLLSLGALHGINPGMGWLFAVALGMQEEKGRAVWRALPPLALGHALAIGAALLVALVVGTALPTTSLKWLMAIALCSVGVYRLKRHRHPRFGGMRVNARDLTIWSFLMANAHGAGLMVLPVLLSSRGHSSAHAIHHHGAALAAGFASPSAAAVSATVLHSAGYLFVTGAIALLVYQKLGLKLLRKMWFNLDALWAVALVVTALLTVVI